ncbi:MAG: sugar-binding protein, partial [Bacteroidota bacterium]
ESGSSRQVTLTTDNAWSVSNLPNWLTVNTTSGSGNTTLMFTSSQVNEEPSSRTAQVIITSGSKEVELLVTQTGMPISLTYLPQAISVDGLQDDIWSSVPWQGIDMNVLGTTPDSRDRFKVAYTRDFLYFLVRVQDSSPNFQRQGDTLYVGDKITVGLDIGNDKASFYGEDDYLFNVEATGSVLPVTDTEDIIEATVNDISAGYVYEMAIRWDDLGTIPTNQALLGLEVAVADNQTGSGVEQANQWFGDKDLLSSTPFAWGTARLEGPDIPWYEAFNGVLGSTEDTGATAWTIDLSGATLSDANDYFKIVGGGIAEARDLDGEAILRSEIIDVSAIDRVSVSVDAKERGNNERSDNSNYVRLFVAVDGGTEMLVDELVGDTSEDDTFMTLSGNGFSGSTLQVIVKVANDRGGTYHAIDNVLVDVGSLENCGMPENPTVVALADTQATLSWQASLDGLTTFEVQFRPTGTTDWQSVIVENVDSATIENLSADTEYEWRVRQNCLTLDSDWVSGSLFTTLEPTNLVTIFRETFDTEGCSPTGSSDGSTYACYSDSTATYSGSAFFNDSFNDGSYESASNGYHVFLSDSGQVFTAMGINTVGYTNLVLQFGIRKNGDNQNGSDLRVEVTQNGTDWSTVPVSLPTGDGTSLLWYLKQPSSASITQTTNFGIRLMAEGSAKYRIDDIEVRGEDVDSVVCDTPQNLAAVSVEVSTANVTWSSIAPASEGYDIRLRPAGTADWSVESTTTEDQFSFTALSENVTYEWQVRSRCSAGTVSAWSSGQFTTSLVPVVTIIQETHDRPDCIPTVLNVGDYDCYSATTVDHSGTGTINSNLDNAD